MSADMIAATSARDSFSVFLLEEFGPEIIQRDSLKCQQVLRRPIRVQTVSLTGPTPLSCEMLSRSAFVLAGSYARKPAAARRADSLFCA